MTRFLSLALLLLICHTALHAADPTDAELRKKPVTNDRGELGKLLNQWYRDGTAAGNIGDWYDNRDGEHSPLNLALHPQLRKIAYTPEDIKARRHWALQPRLLPQVVFGNSSTSAPPQTAGSNVRMYYCSQRGLDILQQHYLGNNLYIYPEHRDHDPGHNGVGDGYGDLYPTNTPYLLTSQGSSGTDQPFMHAVPYALAALRPEVKKKLIDSGLLMPAVQMIFRSSNRIITRPEDYYTGKAHPTVFEGANVQPLAMIKRAHALRLDSLPPLVKLSVIEESKSVPGLDYFEPQGLTEQHSDTVSVISRIWRGKDRSRKLVVSAEKSIDLNNRPLTFRWVVLRGDERRVRITPRDKDGRVVEMELQYHERRPIAPGSPMESNRVDIGVFAHNGVHPSAPAFITFFSLDNEARDYDDQGRIREIGYGMGFSTIKIQDEAKLFALLADQTDMAEFLGIADPQRQELGRLAPRVAEAARLLETHRKERQVAEQARNKANADLRAAESRLADLRKQEKETPDRQKAEKALADARTHQKTAMTVYESANKTFQTSEQALRSLLEERRPALENGARTFVEARLNASMRTRTLWNSQQSTIRAKLTGPENAKRRGLIDSARKKLLQLGIAEELKDGSLKFLAEGRFTQAMIEEFNSHVLTQVVAPELLRPAFHPNFVDFRLGTAKTWRDVYAYRGDQLLGWKRFSLASPPQEYTAEGWLVTERDANNRPLRARPVTYIVKPIKSPGRVPLEVQPTDEVITFAYEGETRRIQSREKSPAMP